ncbi:hypothetical protein JG687_00007763 [Phytophthora cactorum]|uniref:Ribonuclease H1 N-terminal domain-containing protein n=1 Tax=Phytophthora cactorum TaxID=29920 RepID=A0A8T1UG24_9STRA|nr:hypothetical protein PC120_g15513 [Phytophthora cactorum]KAG3076717.1 hypothetical protein PC121_g7618 [Phytophthora cactorum]KAG3174995.1 hypothetical protein PC128_g17902 [Phytophthora cactorum]KAG4049110.1 hypothetical protein PC123_g15594 [Phytophthora cactorum]KAG6961305.1 hypothetical protein JG687_00007763 [Phytophthora cactorum]
MGWDYDSSSSSSCSESSTDMAYGDSSVHSDNEEMEEAGEEEEEQKDLDWYYAVVIGRCRGIFTRVKDALQHTRGYSNSTFRKFPTFEEAREFLNQYGLQVDHEYQHFDCSRLWFAYAMNVETSQTLSTPVLLWPSVGVVHSVMGNRIVTRPMLAFSRITELGMW